MIPRRLEVEAPHVVIIGNILIWYISTSLLFDPEYIFSMFVYLASWFDVAFDPLAMPFLCFYHHISFYNGVQT